MSDRTKGGLVRLREIVEGCEGRTVSVAITFTPTTQEVNLSVNGDEFIPGVAIQTGDSTSYRTLDDLANDLIDDLAAAAITAHANEPTPKKARRRR